MTWPCTGCAADRWSVRRSRGGWAARGALPTAAACGSHSAAKLLAPLAVLSGLTDWVCVHGKGEAGWSCRLRSGPRGLAGLWRTDATGWARGWWPCRGNRGVWGPALQGYVPGWSRCCLELLGQGVEPGAPNPGWMAKAVAAGTHSPCHGPISAPSASVDVASECDRGSAVPLVSWASYKRV